MPLDQFLIAPLTEGLENDVDPWLLPENAFAELSNAYVWRGKLRKRFGSQLLNPTSGVPPVGYEQLGSRLRTPLYAGAALPGGAAVGITDGAGAATGIIAATFVIGQKFSIGDASFTIASLATGAEVMTQNGSGATTATFDAATGTYVFNGAPATTQIYWYDLTAAATTDAITGNLTAIVPGEKFKIGQMFSVNKPGAVGPEVVNEVFTVTTAGYQQDMLKTGPSTGYKFSTTTGLLEITGAAKSATVHFYPAEPVMGFANYESPAINDEPTYAYDTQFAYFFSGTAWERLGLSVWAGNDSQFFWSENYRGEKAYERYLFVTNNKSTDNIRFYNGTDWTNFAPLYPSTPGDTIEGCRCILQFKNRLLFFNTFEASSGTTRNFVNRVRYSQDGNIVEADAFYEGKYIAGKGGYQDAATKEAIISVKLLRDRVIVFFERSTWELVFTGNQIRPFAFQRINAELGVESTNSTVLFDKAILGVGNVGVHACNGADVERIDDKIPEEVFNIHNDNDGVERVYGIRDYPMEMVYWSFPDDGDPDPTYPTRVMTYNYRTKTWGINTDSITAFGYFQNVADLTWAAINITWGEWDTPWGAASYQSQYRQVIAGNQEGYTFLIAPNLPMNAPVIQITDMSAAGSAITITAINHNMVEGEFVNIENVQVVTGVVGVDGIYKISAGVTTNTFVIEEPAFVEVYKGGGTISRVSKIDIKTKRYNFYQKSGRNVMIPKVAYYVKRTSGGQITVDFYTSASVLSLLEESTASGAILGTGILETTPYTTVNIEKFQDKFWHVLYPQAEGESVQMRFYLSDEQMLDSAIALSDFQMHAMSIYARAVHRY